MTRYHISPTTGKPNKCTATKRACPIGGADEHYTTKEEAREAYESFQKPLTVAIPMKKLQSNSDDLIASLPADPLEKVKAIVKNHEKFPAFARTPTNGIIPPIPTDIELRKEETARIKAGGYSDVDEYKKIIFTEVDGSDIHRSESNHNYFVVVNDEARNYYGNTLLVSCSTDLAREYIGMGKREATNTDKNAYRLVQVERQKLEDEYDRNPSHELWEKDLKIINEELKLPENEELEIEDWYY